jgi:hypothetical protein
MRELASNHDLLQRELLNSQQALAEERQLVEHPQLRIDSDILIHECEMSEQEYESFFRTSSEQLAAKMYQIQEVNAELSFLRTVLPEKDK